MHTTGKGLEGRLDKILQLGEGQDFRNICDRLLLRYSEDRAVKQDVFLGRQLKHGGMDFYKTALFKRGNGCFEKRLERQDQSMSDIEILSFRYTEISAPSSPRYWTRLYVKES